MRISDWSSDVCSSDRPLCLPFVGAMKSRMIPYKTVNKKVPNVAYTSWATPYPGYPDCVEALINAHAQSAATRIAHERVSRSEEHTSELQSLMRISYAVFCLKKKKNHQQTKKDTNKTN